MKQIIDDLRSIYALKLMLLAMNIAPKGEGVEIAKLVRGHILGELPSALRDIEARHR